MKNQIGARLVFENAKDALATANGWQGMKSQNGKYIGTAKNNVAIQDIVDSAIISQSYLRLEQLMTLSVSQYNLPILNNQTNGAAVPRATEKRLNQQDCFYISDIGFYLGKAASAADVSFPLYTFPDPVTFPTGVTNNALYTFYNGQWSLLVNGVTVIPGMDIQRFLMVPQTQLTAATNSPISEYYGAGDLSAQCVIEPNLLFNGQKNNQLSFTLPGAFPSALDTFTYVVVMVRGVLMQNVTIVS